MTNATLQHQKLNQQNYEYLISVKNQPTTNDQHIDISASTSSTSMTQMPHSLDLHNNNHNLHLNIKPNSWLHNNATTSSTASYQHNKFSYTSSQMTTNQSMQSNQNNHNQRILLPNSNQVVVQNAPYNNASNSIHSNQYHSYSDFGFYDKLMKIEKAQKKLKKASSHKCKYYNSNSNNSDSLKCWV